MKKINLIASLLSIFIISCDKSYDCECCTKDTPNYCITYNDGIIPKEKAEDKCKERENETSICKLKNK